PQETHRLPLATEELNVSHIWVDALCIVQDDDQDKMKEIAHMGQIYTNAYL
ncbi:hypothetical protein B0H67DRAFT_463917, partial [Lasiosphaeris hirsuta]